MEAEWTNLNGFLPSFSTQLKLSTQVYWKW